jgi:2-methylisocitrate lyase-like PEP mutase family enzyme
MEARPAQPARKTTALRKLVRERHAAGKSIICPTAHDCVTAKLIEQCGFEFINVAGAAPTAVWTGEPECGVVTVTELAFAAGRILGCVNIPGKANVAQGGNALNVIRAVREYERAGVALVQLEDQSAGHTGGYIPGKQLVSVEEMTGKIRAARYAREDPDLMIAARTDAKLGQGGGFEELLRRCAAYVEAGAEVVMPHGLETAQEWSQAAKSLRPLGVPLIASLSAGLLFTPKEQRSAEHPSFAQLEDMGWTILAYANHILHIQLTAAREYLDDLLKPPHDISRWVDRVMDNGERNRILGLSTWRALEEQFVPGDEVKQRYAAGRKKDDYVYRDLEEARARVREELIRKGIKP